MSKLLLLAMEKFTILIPFQLIEPLLRDINKLNFRFEKGFALDSCVCVCVCVCNETFSGMEKL